MRHNVAGRLFHRTANQRKALLRGLAGSLLEHERIETTVAKAKETRKIVERLVTLGKRGDLHAKRIAMTQVPNRELIIKLFDQIAPRFKDRNGGYLRIVPTRQRINDRSEMAIIEFVDYTETRKAAPAKDAASKPSAEKAEKSAKAPKAEKAEKAPKAPKAEKKARPKSDAAAKPKKAAPKKPAASKPSKKGGA